MGMTERDKKVLMVVLALLVVGGVWFLVVGKKRSQIKDANAALATAQSQLAQAKAAESQARLAAKVKPAAYSRLLRLGKAIPVDDDFQSLLVQIDSVTTDANVSMTNLSVADTPSAGTGATGTTTCEELASSGASAPAGGASAATAAPPPAAPTGSTAASFVGKSIDKAEGAVATSKQRAEEDQAAAKAEACQNAPTLTDLTAQAAGLSGQSYTLTFTGSFYNLQDVFDGILDLVKVHNARISVTGRLLDINSISLSVEQFPNLSATVAMTGYVLPSSEATSQAAADGAQTPQPAPAAAPVSTGAE